ncbi:hypothetical protein Tco_0728987 [Tanacetum coccineum]|uniref:Uncharacterized protein n=1 Tax=Tanacetum coccineum TaxID=301880 RepID=A0ABQ4YNV3_9ASTR
MQQKIERLQAQLGDLKGKSKDTPCISDTLDPLSQKLQNEKMELEFQVLNYAKENAHLNTTYKNLFDSIKVTRAQTKTIIDSLQDKLHDTIYENAKLRAQLFDKVIPKVGKTNALSKLVTSNSAPFFRESTVVNNERVIAPGIFIINSLKNSRVNTFVPNKHVKASFRTKPITASQPHVITKKDVNSNTNGLPFKEVESTTKTRRSQSRSNPKNDRAPSKSSKGNNIKLAIRNEKSKVVCATCKQCLITANHDKCVFKYVNGMNSRKKNKSANVSKSENQKKHKPNVKNLKMLGSNERLASPRPSKPRTCLRWLPTGRIFDLCGKITASSNIESESDTSVYDIASASNHQEPTSKGFPNSTSFLDRQGSALILIANADCLPLGECSESGSIPIHVRSEPIVMIWPRPRGLDARLGVVALDASEVVAEKAKKKRKRKVTGDASGSVYPPKKLRDDYQPLPPPTGGKSLTALRGMIPAGSAIPSDATGPLVTASVTPILDVGPVDSSIFIVCDFVWFGFRLLSAQIILCLGFP